nr:ribonuclease H-like domain-containing protein [Tanacetum cinerariifolium]
ENVLVITALKVQLNKLKGKTIITDAVSLNTIDPELLKVDVAPLVPKLPRQGLVRGLLKLKFEKDHLCSACAMGKSTRKTHKLKFEDTNQEKLYLLHMDLCGPMRVESVNGKKYILVIVDDYSQFTWRLWQSPIFTQNRSIIRLRHGKTLSGPALNEMTPRTISSGLVPTSSASTSYVPPSRNDCDLLFQPMFDELLNPPPSVVNQTPEAITLIAEVIPPDYVDSTGLPSSTTVEQAHMGSDPPVGIPIPDINSEQSTIPASPQAIVQTDHPLPHNNSKWTKDHPLNNIIALKEQLIMLKGKAVLTEAVSLNPIDPALLQVDVAPLVPKLCKNRTAHTDYIRHTQEEAATLREIVESERLLSPLNTSLAYACKYTRQIQ